MVRARKYADEVFVQVVEMLAEGQRYFSIARELGIPRDTVKKWVHQYERLGLVGLGAVATYKVYSPELKRAAVLQFLDGATKSAVMAEFGVRNKTTLERWITAYRESGEDAFRKTRGRPPAGAAPESVEQKLFQLEMENAALKKLQALVAEERRQH